MSAGLSFDAVYLGCSPVKDGTERGRPTYSNGQSVSRDYRRGKGLLPARPRPSLHSGDTSAPSGQDGKLTPYLSATPHSSLAG